MDSCFVHLGDESSSSVLIRQDTGADTAHTGRNDIGTVPARTSSYIVPAGTHLHIHDLYGAFLQIKSIVLKRKSGENNEFKG